MAKALSAYERHVKGLNHVLAGLQRMAATLPKLSKKGLIRLGLLIQREAMLRTPIDLGNLRSSAYTAWSGGDINKSITMPNFKGGQAGQLSMSHEKTIMEAKQNAATSIFNPVVEVGFSAYYAVFVHENLEARHKVGESKYLQKAISHVAPSALALVADDMSPRYWRTA